MILATFSTAAFCFIIFSSYNWDFLEWCLFGSIASATDPVAVVAILRELSASETLSVIIEGESLFNDGMAILFFEIFKELVTSDGDEIQGGALGAHIIKKFIQLAVGGPVFGFVAAKIAIFLLNRIFNDATVEITITLVSAYLTFYVGEEILGVSGILAVVILGIVMNSERTSISPDSEHALHHFWEMVGYLANTVLFVIVGITSVETAVSSFVSWTDVGYLCAIYFLLAAIR